MASCELICGDSLTVLPTMPGNLFDAVVTDPPYGLTDLPVRKVASALRHWLDGDLGYIPEGRGFMANSWDKFVPPPALWAECLRVLKPGGHAAVFASSRTLDLMGLSLRLAGFEVRDTLFWAFGVGMPKGKGLLKPAFEPILLVRKPFTGSAAANQAEWNVGTLFTEACRIPFRSEADLAEAEAKNRHTQFGTKQGNNHVYGDYTMVGDVKSDYDGSAGRWPANLLLSHSPGCVPASAGQVTSNMHFPAARGRGGIGSERHAGQQGLVERKPRVEQVQLWDCADGCPVAEIDAQSGGPAGVGGASRFFYTSRASAAERPSYVNEDGKTVSHHTVKPLDLMGWLLRLVVPEGGTVLDCCAGSGTTGEAALLAGFNTVLVEKDPDFVPLIRQRIDRAQRGLAA